MHCQKIMMIVLGIICVSSCSLLQPTTDFKIQAVRSLNPSVRGEPSPLVVTIYQLKNKTAFQNSDYRSLMTRAGTILQADLIDKHSFQVRPGASFSVTEKLNPETRYLGVMAAYRKPSLRGWSKVIKIEKGGILSRKVKLNLAPHEITVTE